MTRPVYATLEQVRTYLSLASQDGADDNTLLLLLNRASRSIDRYCRRTFYPRRETRHYDYAEAQVIRLGEDLLQLDALVTQNGASTVNPNILLLMTGDDYNFPPYDRIAIRTDSGSTLNYSGTHQKANAVTGFWGYHEDWANALVDTGTSLAASYAASATVLSLAGAGSAGTGASDVNYESPRVAIGDLLWIEGELFHVAAAGASGNGSPVVLPHQNGTSANHHPAGTTVYKFAPEPDINWSTIRMVAWLYGQRDTPYETRTAFFQTGTLSIPQTMHPDIRDKLDRFRRVRIRTHPK